MNDKLKHFIVSVILCCGGIFAFVLTGKAQLFPIAIFGTLALGIAKEVWDYNRKKSTVPYYDLKDQCVKDFFADFFGVITGCFISGLIALIF